MLNKSTRTLLAAFFLAGPCAYAQTTFDTRLDAMVIDDAIRPAQDGHGYVLAANMPVGQFFIPALLQFDQDGQMTRQQGFTSNAGYKIDQIATLNSGYAIGLDKDPQELAIAKVGPDFNFEWVKAFERAQSRWAELVPHPDGGVIGLCVDYFTVDNSFRILHLDAQGNLVWAKTYAATRNVRAKSMTMLPDGYLAVAGELVGIAPAPDSIFVTIIDSTGIANSIDVYGDGNSHSVKGLAKLGTDQFAVATAASGNSVGAPFVHVLAFNRTNGFLWARKTTFGDSGVLIGMSEAPNGEVAVYGHSVSPDTSVAVLTVSSAGLAHWGIALFDPSEQAMATGFGQSAYGNLLVSGWNGSLADKPYFLDKLTSNSLSCLPGAQSYVFGSAAFQSGSLNIFTSAGPGIHVTFFENDTVIVSHTVNCLATATPSPSDTKGRIHLFPNPVGSRASFALDGEEFPASTTLVLHDMLGRKFLVPYRVEGRELDFDMDGLPAGLYSYTLEVRGRVWSIGKLVHE